MAWRIESSKPALPGRCSAPRTASLAGTQTAAAQRRCAPRKIATPAALQTRASGWRPTPGEQGRCRGVAGQMHSSSWGRAPESQRHKAQERRAQRIMPQACHPLAKSPPLPRHRFSPHRRSPPLPPSWQAPRPCLVGLKVCKSCLTATELATQTPAHQAGILGVRVEGDQPLMGHPVEHILIPGLPGWAPGAGGGPVRGSAPRRHAVVRSARSGAARLHGRWQRSLLPGLQTASWPATKRPCQQGVGL